MENRNKPAPQIERKPLDLKKVAVAAGILIAVFALGYIPSCVSARSAQERNTRLQRNLRLSDLQGHLGNGNGGADKPTRASAKAKQPSLQDDDYQLAQALSLLKGLSITRGH